MCRAICSPHALTLDLHAVGDVVQRAIDVINSSVAKLKWHHPRDFDFVLGSFPHRPRYVVSVAEGSGVREGVQDQQGGGALALDLPLSRLMSHSVLSPVSVSLYLAPTLSNISR